MLEDLLFLCGNLRRFVLYLKDIAHILLVRSGLQPLYMLVLSYPIEI